MKSNQRSPILPYLCVLACLFVLSLLSPRSWTTSSAQRQSHLHDVGQLTDRAASGSQPRANAAPVQMAPPAARQNLPEMLPTPPAPAISIRPLEPRAAVVSERIADERRFDAAAELALAPTRPSETLLDPRLQSSPLTTDEQPMENIAVEVAQVPVAGWWPQPHSLRKRLDILLGHTATRVWAGEVGKLLDQLGRVASPEDAETPRILKDLEALSLQAQYIVSDRNDGDLAAEMRRVRYALARRLDLWNRISSAEESAVAIAADPHALSICLAEVEQMTQLEPGAADLKKHLMLAALASAAQVGDDRSSFQQRELARQVLARIQSAKGSPTAPRWAEDSSIAKLARHLRRWSDVSYDARELLVAQEVYENGCKPGDGARLAAELHRLASVERPGIAELQEKLEGHYRNANLRVAVRGDFLNRVMPQPEIESSPVRDTIAGVPVRGKSNTLTRLQIRLLPHEKQLRLGLEALGSVESMTSASSGPVTFYSQGDGSFVVRKLIIVDEDGIRVKPAQAEAQSATDIARLETDFDGIPLVRDIVRNYAMSEHRSKQGQAKREVEAKMAITALQRFDMQADSQIAEAESRFQRRLFTPLNGIELDVSPIDLETTAERLYMRFRVASDEQLGAHTARPRAPADSLLSIQIHQTAINNFIERLDLDGRTFSLPELHAWVGQKLQLQMAPLDEDVPDDIEISFADENAITVSCDRGLMELHFSIDRLRQGRRGWREFGIRATYRPAPTGLKLLWQREGVVELTGERYAGRPEIVLRGIFAKVLLKDRPLNLTPVDVSSNPRLAGLAISQCVAEEGWIGIAVGNSSTPAADLSLEAREKSPLRR